MRITILLPLLCCLAVFARPVFARTAEDPGAGRAAKSETQLNRQVRGVLARALAVQEEGDPAGAAKILAKYVADDLADANGGKGAAPAVVHLLLGNMLFESGNVRAAASAYETGLAAYADDPGLCRNLAVARAELGEHETSASLFERAFDLDPEHGVTLLYQAAAGWYRTGQPERAVKALDRLLAAKTIPEERWLELLAHCCQESGDAARAQSVFERLVARFPANPRHWRFLARVRLRRGDYAGAAVALEVCSRLAPARSRDRTDKDRTAELEELASVYMYLDAPLRAAETLERAHGKRPDRPETLDKLFETYARAHRSEAALVVLDRALRLAPSAQRFKRKGSFLFDNGRFAEAVAAYSLALKMAPADADAAMRAGYGALEIDDLQAARSFFKRAASDAAVRVRAEGCLRYVAGLEKARREAEAVAGPTGAASALSVRGGQLPDSSMF